MSKELIPKRIKLNWLTVCPVCGKTHINLWAYIFNDKKKIYECKCPVVKEYFEIELNNL
jgi:transcription elongation factor Elf1